MKKWILALLMVLGLIGQAEATTLVASTLVTQTVNPNDLPPTH